MLRTSTVTAGLTPTNSDCQAAPAVSGALGSMVMAEKGGNTPRMEKPMPLFSPSQPPECGTANSAPRPQ